MNADGNRSPKLCSRDEAPLFAVRVRRRSRRGRRARYIKIRMDGPKPRRWMTFARWWWLKHRGPIPPGMRVVHRDGDTLNDDPANYILATAGDVAYLARQWDPGLDLRNAHAVARATAKHNRDRGRVRRAIAYLPTRWYGVDAAQRIVVNRPFRSRAALLRHRLGAPIACANGAGLWHRWLGWPPCRDLAAFVLTALADGPADTAELRRRVGELLARFGLRADFSDGALWQALQPIRGTAIVALRVPGGRSYAVTEAWLKSRRAGCPLIPCRGGDIERRFPGFQRTLPE